MLRYGKDILPLEPMVLKRIVFYSFIILLTLTICYWMTASGIVYRSGDSGLIVMDFDRKDKLFKRGETLVLYGGAEEDWHFDVTEFRLQPNQLRFGLGREYFHALIDPEFISSEEADFVLQDNARVLVVGINDDVRVYPVSLLITHEIVNDTVGGHPVFAAYCMLAELGAVYERTIAGREHTFALSGYTYWDDDHWHGLNAFVFWDRETESLWWPVTGVAVSGLMIDTPLKLLAEEYWAQTTWGEIKYRFPHANVLKAGQTMEPPESWPAYSTPPEEPFYPEEPQSIAPFWGDNAIDDRKAVGSTSFRVKK